MKELKDYLHLYLGCDVMHTNKNGSFRLQLVVLDIQSNSCMCVHHVPGKKPSTWSYSIDQIKPILRRLQDVEREEVRTYQQFSMEMPMNNIVDVYRIYGSQVAYFLSRRADLFMLIEEGLAIDEKTLQS